MQCNEKGSDLNSLILTIGFEFGIEGSGLRFEQGGGRILMSGKVAQCD